MFIYTGSYKNKPNLDAKITATNMKEARHAYFNYVVGALGWTNKPYRMDAIWYMDIKREKKVVPPPTEETVSVYPNPFGLSNTDMEHFTEKGK